MAAYRQQQEPEEDVASVSLTRELIDASHVKNHCASTVLRTLVHAVSQSPETDNFQEHTFYYFSNRDYLARHIRTDKFSNLDRQVLVINASGSLWVISTHPVVNVICEIAMSHCENYEG